jgi:hypothetical protein
VVLEKISWSDRVRNEVLHGVKEERNILQTVKRRKDNWIGHILHGNCLLKHNIERKWKDTSNRKQKKKKKKT